jgi:tellurite resistance protein TerC
METSFNFWLEFNAAVLLLLALDLFVFHRKAHTVSAKEAALTTLFWVSLSLGFNLLVWRMQGQEAALQFLTGYLVEYSLSVDNIFVFILIFSYFRVPAEYQHRVLFWGILGALVMRGLMIWLGVSLVSAFHWMLYLFGAFLVFTGWKMLVGSGIEVEPEHNPLLKLCRRWMPISRTYEGTKFFTRVNGRRALTPLALVLVMVESTDLLFAVDSIPAIIAITTDPFIVYTSNVCAILGLRSLYFLLARVVPKFIYLKHGLALILGFIGIKMLIADFYKIPTPISLLIVAVTLVASVVISIVATRARSTDELLAEATGRAENPPE